MKFIKSSVNIFWLFLLICIFNTQNAIGQIYGRVMEKESKQPLVGANVYLAHHSFGTITNDEGRFVLSVTGKVSGDTLIINYLGYEEYRSSLSEYENYSTVYLASKSLTLDETIQVYADRMDLTRQEIPHMRYELDAEELDRYAASEIGDIFKKMPSVRLEGNDLDGRYLQIRGSNAGEVNVYYDGILINNLSFDNAADLSVIPTESIYKLEVMKGASLPLLGNGAFGGVVNIISKKDIKPGILVKAKHGDFGTQQYLTHVSVPIDDKLFINYFGQYSEMKPTIEYFPGERFSEKTKNSSINTEKQNHNLNVDYYNSLGQFSLKFFAYNFKYDKPMWINDRNNYLFAFSYFGKNDLNVTLSNLEGFDEVKRYAVESTQYISDYQSRRINLKISKKVDFKQASFQFLSEYYHDELEDLSKLKDLESTKTYYKANLYDNRASLASIFSFTDSYDTLGNLSWKTFIGLRGDIVASGHKDVTVYTGAQLEYHKNNWVLEPYINYGKNVRYPSLLESAYVQDLVKYTTTDTTTQLLEPEYSNSFELGANLKYNYVSDYIRTININAALFSGSVYNKILKRPFADYIVQSQIGRNTTKGIEASIKFEGLAKYFNFTASYIKLDIENRLLYEYKPELSYNFQLEHITPIGAYLTILYFIDGKSYAWYFDGANQLQTNKIKGASDIDVTAGYGFPWIGLDVKLYVAGYNLINNSGYDYYYLRKRNIQLGISLKY
jgi:outer membrane cobalamin receptor